MATVRKLLQEALQSMEPETRFRTPPSIGGRHGERNLQLQIGIPFLLHKAQLTEDDRIHRVLQEIDDNWMIRQSLRDLARGVGLSPSRLSHVLKEQLDLTHGQLLLALRLAHAARMLVSTDLRVSEICYRTGIDDAANFDHLFRRYFACNPTAYRTTRRSRQDPAGERAAP